MEDSQRMFITGASGFVGSHLVRSFTGQNVEIVALSRAARKSEGAVRWIQGTSTEAGDWQKEIDGCQAVVSLAGDPVVGKRWTAGQKQLIRDSRVNTTGRVVEAIRQAAVRPTTLISASAIGIYPKNEETAFDEAGGAADDFLGEVCREWEAAACQVEDLGVRLVILRIGVVLGLGGGALQKMLTPFKLGLGGPLGSGEQWFSWIHIADMVDLIRFCLVHTEVKGVLNAVAPHPVRMKEFSDQLGRALHRPAFFPVPGFMVRLGLGEAAQVVLDGQRILPAAAERAGYVFKFPSLGAALRDLVS